MGPIARRQGGEQQMATGLRGLRPAILPIPDGTVRGGLGIIPHS